MKPTSGSISSKYYYHPDGYLCFAVDSGRFGRYKAGTRAGCVSAKGVMVINLNGKYYQEHQLIWALHNMTWASASIRHKNGNLLDNRIENLSMDFPHFDGSGKCPDIESLRKILSYCPETGVLRWKVRRRNVAMPGDIAGSITDSGYVMVGIHRRQLRAHRIAWALTYGEWPASDLDHKNRVRSDNRLCNLRLATRSENSQNTNLRVDNKTGVKGVSLRLDTGTFSASIALDGESKHLGCYHSLQEAQLARAKAETALHPYRASLTQEGFTHDA